jgi:hypothetical protein
MHYLILTGVYRALWQIPRGQKEFPYIFHCLDGLVAHVRTTLYWDLFFDSSNSNCFLSSIVFCRQFATTLFKVPSLALNHSKNESI